MRAQANNDVRKRDIELQKLKQHLSTQQRGANPSRAPPGQSTGPQCTVIPGKTPRTQGRRRDEGSAPDLEDATYSLKQETTEFLTDLSRGLSDENDALIGLVKSTVDTLRDLMGLPHNKQAHDVAFPDSESSLANPSGWSADEMVFSPPTSYNELTRDMELVLRSLRELLTNPSFAPIEEVLTREEEIQRLRYGWEQMETRWREAVLMMNKWSTRMQNGGDSVNVAELKAGLRLGEGFRSHQQQSPSPARTLDAVEEEDEASEEEGEAGEEEGELDHESSDVFDLERLPPAESPIQASDGPAPLVPDRGVAKPEREATRLREVPGNGQMRRGVTAAKKGVRLEHTKENATSLEHEPGAASRDRGMAPGRVASTQQAVTKGYMKPTTTAKGEGHTTEARPANRVAKVSMVAPTRRSADEHGLTPRTQAAKVGSSGPKSRLPSRTGSKTQLSVQQKLDLAEKEARRASSGSSARRPSSSVMEADDRDSQAEAAPSRAEWEDEEVEDAALLVEKTRSPVKRSRISGKARRRKSTLTRQELRELMLGGSG